MKSIYTELRAQIEENTSVTHVRLWNNQIQLSEKEEQIPFEFPAVFIDFPTIEWGQMGKGTQTADRLIVRLYICFESFHTAENEEDLAVFDLRQEVFLAAQDCKLTEAGKLQRVAEQTDPNHTNVYMWVMDFVTNYQDKIAQFPRGGGVSAQINTLTLATDLIIDPATVDGIRTANEFP